LNFLREIGNSSVVLVDLDGDDGGMIVDGTEDGVGDECEGEGDGREVGEAVDGGDDARDGLVGNEKQADIVETKGSTVTRNPDTKVSAIQGSSDAVERAGGKTDLTRWFRSRLRERELTFGSTV